MAIDISAIRRKLGSLQTTNNKTSLLWKPEPGQNTIRIVPYQFNKDNPFIELFFHYDLGKKNYLSLVTFGEADPIAEFSEKLKATGNSDDWKLARKMEPKMRTFVPVIVRGKESEGVKFWGFGKQIYQELLEFISDPDYGDVTDLSNGRDVKVTFTPPEGQEKWPKTSIMVKPSQTAATEDKNIAEKIVSGQSEIYEVYRKSTYEDLKNALEEWLGEGGEGTAEPVAQTATANATKGNDNIDKAFDDLFNQ